MSLVRALLIIIASGVVAFVVSPADPISVLLYQAIILPFAFGLYWLYLRITRAGSSTGDTDEI
ncbi:MAG: hypothetical protein COA78_04680 [Blastopirellula sp.]|nr:MAG: hypothetical protein COA78_04680 [Blastopirellula sp.]